MTTSYSGQGELARWRHYLGVPITLGGDPWFDLPVGAFVIASSLPEASSTLKTQRSTVEARLERWIETLRPFLNPEADLDDGLLATIARKLPLDVASHHPGP